MESRRQRHTAMSKVREALIRNLEQVFGLERHHVYTHHPLIRRKVVFACLRSQSRLNDRACRACRSLARIGRASRSGGRFPSR